MVTKKGPLFFEQQPRIKTRKELYDEVSSTLRMYALSPKKSLGQHFMVDPNILRSYVEILSNYSVESVVEIGAGVGTLTNLLYEGNFSSMFLIEKDPNFSLILEKKFKNAQIINLDVLSVPLDFWADKDIIVGNIPYEISSPLLYRLTASSFFPHGKLIAFMVQQEFASRMIGTYGTQDYGKLSVNMQLAGLTKIKSSYGPGSFYPAPKVASSLITIQPLNETLPLIKSTHFQSFLTELFTRKNKTVKSLLKAYIKRKKMSETIRHTIESDPQGESRVKDLSPEDFIDLFQRIGYLIFM